MVTLKEHIHNLLCNMKDTDSDEVVDSVIFLSNAFGLDLDDLPDLLSEAVSYKLKKEYEEQRAEYED